MTVTVTKKPKTAIIIPCYKVAGKIEDIISRIGPDISRIYCIDDACPAGSGDVLDRLAHKETRMTVLHHAVNGGVGASMVTGYRAALNDGMDILVKLDGDGQMPPELVPFLTEPICEGQADYVKGNRFFNITSLRTMPRSRMFGNIILSFMTKISTGYWHLFDPVNGFTALHSGVARELGLEKLSPRYFFESDMLFRLSIIRANIVEVPMESSYEDEVSNMSAFTSALTFPFLHLRNFLKRLGYSYFLRGFSLASLSLVVGIILLVFGLAVGITAWTHSYNSGIPATTGTVMLAALPFLLGVEMLFNFLNFDISNVPKTPIHKYLDRIRVLRTRKDDLK